jgi:hypothetical protein
MDLEKLREKLLLAARNEPVSDHVPYAFEQRVMACLGAHRPADPGALWARALWRAAAVCVALSLLLSFWSLSSTANSSTVTLETAVMSGAEQLIDTW